MKPWITNRLGELLGVEDDVVIEYVFNQLEEKVSYDFVPSNCITGALVLGSGSQICTD